MEITTYQGNPNLVKAGVKQEYTEEQIREIIKCAEDPIYFIKNYIHIINIDKGLIKFELYDFQEEYVNILHTKKRIIGKLPRQVGKTVTTSAYFCHYSIFNSNKTTAILANKASTAREILHNIKIMIENLPSWLKPGISEWNKGSIEFENGSRIVTAATSSSAIRGMSIANLLLDEFAFVSSGVFEDFIQSVYPTISSSKDAKIVMISTPWGLNHFYKFWTEAEKGINGFTPFGIEWDDVPGRDEAWKEQMIKEVGRERFSQEFAGSFIGSSNTLIEVKTLRNLVYQDPISVQMMDKFFVYEKPEKDHQYVCVCDVAEGGGGDYSTIQMIDVTELPYNQVATYNDNTIKTHLFSTVINSIASAYNSALVIVESNAIGLDVINNLNYNEEYENLFYDKDFGIKMTKGSKSQGCSHLKTFIETDKIHLNDINTIEQLTYFTKNKNGTFSADDRKHDDLVTPLILFSYFMSKEDLVDYWLEKENILGSLYKGAAEQIEEELMPIGFFPDSYLDEEY